MRPRVFGIGAHKTGTSSLTEALNILGYRASHWNDRHKIHTDAASGNYRLTLMDHVEAVSDLPIPTIWRGLASAFPDGLFILTIRDPQTWINSVEHHVTGRDLAPEEQAFYHCDHYDRETFLAVYTEHNHQVMSHFAGRSNFLTIDIPGGDGWSQLCGFLGIPEPEPLPTFPWLNRRKNRR